MYYLSCNLSVFAIAALVCSFSWIWGGTRGDLFLRFVPWFSLLLIEVMFAFPQRVQFETSGEARLRMWRSVFRDRLTWLCIAFLLLLAVPFVNTTYKAVPWCVDRGSHLNVYLWFFPSLLAMIAAKHALRRPGKRLLLEVFVWNGVALAAFGFLELFTGAQAPYWSEVRRNGVDFFATFGYANMGGDYFTSLTMLAIGLWRWRLADIDRVDTRRDTDHTYFWRKHYPLIAVVILYFAALNTLSRSAIMLATLGAAFLFAQLAVIKMKHMERLQRVRFTAVLLGVFAAVTLFALMFTPEKIRREIDTIDATGVVNRISGRNECHTRVAAEILAENPLFGCGGWGYLYLCPAKLPESITSQFHYDWCRGMANVHNDYMQFLCEHGFVGFALLVAIVIFAVMPAAKRWKRMATDLRFARHTGLPWPKGFFCFPPEGIAIYTAAATTLIHALGDCPFRSPAVMSLFFVELVLVDGYLPRDE